jgi:hypothetical protein
MPDLVTLDRETSNAYLCCLGGRNATVGNLLKSKASTMKDRDSKKTY